MKKLYTLLALLSLGLSFGQSSDLYFSMYGEGSSNNKFLEIYNGTGAAVDLSGYSVELYANGAVTASNTQTFPAMTMLASGDVYVLRNGGSSIAAIATAADISSSTCNFNGDDAIALKKAGVVIDVIGEIGVDPGTSWAVGSTTDGTLNHTLVRKLTVCSPNAVNLSSFGTNDTNSEWTVYAIDGELGQLGTHVGCSTDPSLTITSPANATVFNPTITSVNIGLSVANFNVATPSTGNGYIKYTVNGGAAIDKFNTTDIGLSSLMPGIYTVVVDLVDNSGAPLSPAISQTVMFEIADFITVTNLAAIRTDVTANGLGRYYNLTGEALVTYTRTSRNQKYIQDASAGALIDDVPATISTTFVIGDGMTGLKAQTSAFAGVLQLNPVTNVTVSSTGNTISPIVVTNATIAANLDTYESRLVQINGATFTTADGTLPFTTNGNFNINDGTDLTFRAIFSEADYIGQVVPSGVQNLTVLVSRNNATPQVVARALAGIVLNTNTFDAIDGLKMYPNPVSGSVLNISSDANSNMEVQVYDLLGKEVLKATVNNNVINIGSLQSGVYVVKITEDTKTATRKLVIK